MAVSKLELRLSALEAEVAMLKQKMEGTELPWWEVGCENQIFLDVPNWRRRKSEHRRSRESPSLERLNLLSPEYLYFHRTTIPPATNMLCCLLFKNGALRLGFPVTKSLISPRSATGPKMLKSTPPP